MHRVERVMSEKTLALFPKDAFTSAGAFSHAQEALPHLEKSKGVIVNVSSIAAVQPSSMAAYCVAKAAQDMVSMA